MASAIQHPRQWIRPTARGLYCVPGDFYVDPASQVARAIITHGHGDHARPGNESVLATAETIAIMRTRFGDDAGSTQAIAYGEAIRIGEVMVRLAPAGHILGSAQVVLDYGRRRVVISGDYKRRADETCAPFEPVAADVFVTEATFGLPVFRHPDDGGEIAKVLRSLCLFPERAHLVGVYGLGKCQRVLRLLRPPATTVQSISTARSPRCAGSTRSLVSRSARRARPRRRKAAAILSCVRRRRCTIAGPAAFRIR